MSAAGAGGAPCRGGGRGPRFRPVGAAPPAPAAITGGAITGPSDCRRGDDSRVAGPKGYLGGKRLNRRAGAGVARLAGGTARTENGRPGAARRQVSPCRAAVTRWRVRHSCRLHHHRCHAETNGSRRREREQRDPHGAIPPLLGSLPQSPFERAVNAGPIIPFLELRRNLTVKIAPFFTAGAGSPAIPAPAFAPSATYQGRRPRRPPQRSRPVLTPPQLMRDYRGDGPRCPSSFPAGRSAGAKSSRAREFARPDNRPASGARRRGIARDGTRLAYALHGRRRRRDRADPFAGMDRAFWQPVAERLARHGRC